MASGANAPVNVAVDVGKEPGQLNGQRLEALAQLVQLLHNQRRRRHVGRAQTLAQIPHGHARLLQVADLPHPVLRVEDQRLERPGQAGHLDQVRRRRGCWNLHQYSHQGQRQQRHEDGRRRRGARARHAVEPVPEPGEGGLEGLGAVLDFGADGEADV